MNDSRPLIFLDFDGVLTNDRWERSHQSFSFDPSNVEWVNQIVAETDADIVISSDWRRLSFDRVCNRLEDAGIVRRPIGTTPWLESNPKAAFSRISRGEEIDAWLRQQHFIGCFVILDDGSDMAPHQNRLVQVDSEFGLREVDAKRAISILTAMTSIRLT